LEDRREFEPLQKMLIAKLCRPIMEDFVFVWALRNAAATDYFVRDTPESVDWQGQGWDWVDPEAQGKGVALKMALGLTTRTKEANLLGTSVAKLDREIATDGTLDAVQRTSSTPAPAGSPPQPTPEVANAPA
jgi:capsid protein